MKINSKGLRIIKDSEDCKLKAYVCPAGVWTIGWGHTGDVYPGQVIDQEEADQLLAFDAEEAENQVKSSVKVPLNENQFSALVSFTFNLGPVNLKSSTLLKYLNSKEYNKAANEFPKWNKSKGKVLNGLVKRRAAERELFLEDA